MNLPFVRSLHRAKCLDAKYFRICLRKILKVLRKIKKIIINIANLLETSLVQKCKVGEMDNPNKE